MAAKRACTPTRTDRLLGLDGRERIARQIRDTRNALLASLPQPIGPVQAALAERAAILQAHLTQLDANALNGSGLQPAELRMYSSLTSQLGRLLKQLNSLRAVRPAGPSIDELFGEEGAAA